MDTEVESKPKLSDSKYFILVLIIIMLCAFLIRTFIIEPFTIPSGSMESTIMTGDSIIAEKVTYTFAEPEIGDIVIFDSTFDDKQLIKRVIAKEGQTVDLINGQVYVDGVELEEPYTHGKPSFELYDGIDIEYPYTVPEGYIWVMGDNRTNSADSRYFGPVPLENVRAKALVTYYPFDRIKTIE